MRIRNSLAGYVIAVLIVLLFFPAQSALAWTANYVSNPTSCPASDVQFPGQLCPGVLKICGVNGSSIPQCYDMSTLAAPGSTTTSNTVYSGSLGGGYVIDCNATLDSAAPYCNNNGSAWCNRSDTCFTTKKRITSCTAGSFATYTCGSCNAGYQDCAGDDVCEVTTGTTNYPTGANNNYGSSCTAQCDASYLDCDAAGPGNTNGCEILNGGTCGTHAIYSGCSAPNGNCVCQGSYLDCDAAGPGNTNGCEILNGGTCGTNATYNGCSAPNGNCACNSGYYDCDASGPNAGNGCEVHTGNTCTTPQGVAGTYNGCMCVPNKSYFQTGTDSVYSTGDPLLWGQQVGTGKIMSFMNASQEVLSLTASGAFTLRGKGSALTVSGAITTQDNLTLNGDNGAVDAIISFGNALGTQTLKFLNTDQKFQFSTNLDVLGNLTVGGTINGTNLSSLAGDAGRLKVSTGAGLSVAVAAGNYNINGTLIAYNGGTGIAVQANTSNYVYLTATGVLVGAAYPTNRSFIPLARVQTSGAAVTGITDQRATASDSRERSQYLSFNPAYSGASYSGDGANNVGSLYVTNENGVPTNYYKWVTTKSTLQDYDITLRATVPYAFFSWLDPAMVVNYKTDTTDSNDNAVSVSVYDTTDNPVTLSGSALNLTSASWTTTRLEYMSGTWTPGQMFRMVFHVAAKANHYADLGATTLWLKELVGG